MRRPLIMESLLGSRKVERWRRVVATKMHLFCCSTTATPSTWALCLLPEGSMLPCRPPAVVDLQLCSCRSWQPVGPTADGTKSLGPWRAPIRGPESHGRWQCPPLQMSPLDRGVDRERPRRRAGSRPCGLPASGLSCQFSENQLSLGPTSATVSQSPGWQTPPRPRPGKPSRSPRSSPRSPAPTCSSWWASRSARSTRS